MNTYKIRTHELWWHDCVYHVEANSEQEALLLVDIGEAFIDKEDYDTTEQIDFESVEKIDTIKL